MKLLKTFEVASGTTAGRRHRTASNLANNQDVVAHCLTDHLIVAALSDGCGSQPYSELGARLTVNLILKLTRRLHAQGHPVNETSLKQVFGGVQKRLQSAARLLLDGDTVETLNAHMMATGGGIIMTPQTTTFFGVGDFVFQVNDELVVWEPREGNAPLYPAFSTQLRMHEVPTADIQYLLFATDGGKQLVEVCGDPFELVPGTDDRAGPLDKLWETDIFFDEPDALGYWLNSLAQNWRLPGPPHHGGLLEDDTSVIVLRRRNVLQGATAE